jgi:putative flippase GtrA
MRPIHPRLAGQFLRFGVVGTGGFLVDTALLYLALWAGAGLYGGRVFSYIGAASFTFALNRAWTFRGAARTHAGKQWALFLVVNLIGFALNYGTYAVLVAVFPLVAANPVLGVAAGSIAGLGGNFLASRRFVFRGG